MWPKNVQFTKPPNIFKRPLHFCITFIQQGHFKLIKSDSKDS